MKVSAVSAADEAYAPIASVARIVIVRPVTNHSRPTPSCRDRTHRMPQPSVNAAAVTGGRGSDFIPTHGISAIDWKLALYSSLAKGTAAARMQPTMRTSHTSGLGRGSRSPVQSASPTNVSGTT